MSAPAVRVEPVSPPFPPELQAVFDRIMPPGVPPLRRFTTLARVPRIAAKTSMVLQNAAAMEWAKAVHCVNPPSALQASARK